MRVTRRVFRAVPSQRFERPFHKASKPTPSGWVWAHREDIADSGELPHGTLLFEASLKGKSRHLTPIATQRSQVDWLAGQGCRGPRGGTSTVTHSQKWVRSTWPAGEPCPPGSRIARRTPRRCAAAAIIMPSWPPPRTPRVRDLGSMCRQRYRRAD